MLAGGQNVGRRTPTVEHRHAEAQDGFHDIEIDESAYRADFEIATKFQSISKELLRIAFLGLGVIGVLIKLSMEKPGHNVLNFLQAHRVSGIFALGAFTICVASSLFHVFLTSLRHLRRLEGDAWDDHNKKLSRAFIDRQREEQKCAIKHASRLLLTATTSLSLGALLVAYCATSVLLSR